ncbi:7 pass integral membrane proteinwith FLHWFHH motif shared with fatty-acyl elongase [Cryptosporidium ryanae]|uniref:7 pass integral membrane proteinwith FLHWFHH motif shared with fatty-acyl elongase n=1 Tax=Cryptosporidium ryanae TaxID=515981 RepID=UPI00351AAF1C|nr:7 pass integral membrane proteinwith FLHWFHH motif shared with fatty-acyl elongase [Cryptosporidium ryanae]
MIIRNNDGGYIINEKTGIWEIPMDSEFMDLLKEIPWFRNFILPLEEKWNGIGLFIWTNDNYYLAHVICILYALFVYFGPKIMEKRKPMKLDKTLRYWNLFLAIFSLIGTSRLFPYVITNVVRYGFVSSICSPPIVPLTKGPASLWLSLFIYSKYFELIDTFFIVARKRPLSFLHWFHHLTVLLYTWDAYVSCQTIGTYFCAINYFVHSIMYFYYYLSCCGVKPKWGITITILQIIQMIIGTLLTAFGMYYSFKHPFSNVFPVEYVQQPLRIGCHFIRTNGVFACLMYISYFALFFDFFIKRYVTKGTPIAQWIASGKDKIKDSRSVKKSQ